MAKEKSEVAGQLHQEMMARLKAAGGYFPKPNPNADPNANRYDPKI